MNILLEGPDGSGKSTLADMLMLRLGLPVQASEGPPKYPGEIHDRLKKYALLNGIIFDRHPVVSQVIYGYFRTTTTDIPTFEEREQFYNLKPLIIYCRANGHVNHVIKDHDTREHLSMVDANDVHIRNLYDQWGLKHAHMLYRIGDDVERLSDMIHTWLMRSR